jgi:hypothetical protein
LGSGKWGEGSGFFKFDWQLIVPLKTDLLSDVRGGTVSPKRWKALAGASGMLTGVCLYICTSLRMTVNEGRGQEAGGRFCNGDLCPAPKTFRLKRRGFRPDFFDNC